jgi:hypothetical protein
MDLKPHIALIQETLEKGLNHIRPVPQVVIEEADYGGKLYVFVVSRHFSRKSMTDRDNEVWGVLDRELPRETWVKIARLFVLTPREAKFWLEPEEEAAGTEEDRSTAGESLTTARA